MNTVRPCNMRSRIDVPARKQNQCQCCPSVWQAKSSSRFLLWFFTKAFCLADCGRTGQQTWLLYLQDHNCAQSCCQQVKGCEAFCTHVRSLLAHIAVYRQTRCAGACEQRRRTATEHLPANACKTCSSESTQLFRWRPVNNTNTSPQHASRNQTNKTRKC